MIHKEQFENTANGLLVRAPAKINLSLLIAGKRPDGFHEIETIMAKVNFYDEILIQQGQKQGIELICQGPQWAPAGKENLIYQACHRLLEKADISADIWLTLTKNIPAGSGLGSASSDAAATLIGINKFLNLGFDREQLSEIAASLGSDVAFFLGGPLTFCTGKGEKIKKLEKKFEFSALLILPDISVSTKEVYAHYRHNRALYEQRSSQINDYLNKNRIDLVTSMCANMLQISCFGLYKGLGQLKTRIESLGLGRMNLSGSGSAMFYIAETTNMETLTDYKHVVEEKIGCKSIIVSDNRW